VPRFGIGIPASLLPCSRGRFASWSGSLRWRDPGAAQLGPPCKPVGGGPLTAGQTSWHAAVGEGPPQPRLHCRPSRARTDRCGAPGPVRRRQPGTAEHASHGAAFRPERAARTQGPMTIAVQTQSVRGPMRRIQCGTGRAHARFHRSLPQPGGPFFQCLVFSPLPARALRDLESRPRNWRRAAYRSSGLNDEKNADRRDPRGRNPRGRAGW
jgi:hypothetical protein